MWQMQVWTPSLAAMTNLPLILRTRSDQAFLCQWDRINMVEIRVFSNSSRQWLLIRRMIPSWVWITALEFQRQTLLMLRGRRRTTSSPRSKPWTPGIATSTITTPWQDMEVSKYKPGLGSIRHRVQGVTVPLGEGLAWATKHLTTETRTKYLSSSSSTNKS